MQKHPLSLSSGRILLNPKLNSAKHPGRHGSCIIDAISRSHHCGRSVITMDFGGLDLNLLVALDALFTEKSVSRAGERLHLSQSATSGALSRLRDAFHDPLLVQVGRRMALTPVAEGLIEPVREFLIQAESI